VIIPPMETRMYEAIAALADKDTPEAGGDDSGI
jgi:hypothetical protein